MSSSAATFETRVGKYCVVEADTPEQGTVKLGILLQDPQADSLRLRFRRDLESVANEDLDVLRALAGDLAMAPRWAPGPCSRC